MQVKSLVIAILMPWVTGGATFGAIALHHHGLGSLVGSKRVHAAAQSSPEPEGLLANWPRQCDILRQKLRSQSDLAEVTYEARPLAPFVTPAWKLHWQGETIALPLVDYSNVQVVRNEDGKLFVLLEDAQAETRVMLNQLKQPQPLVDVFATAPHPSLSLAKLQSNRPAAAIAPSTTAPKSEIKALAVNHSRSGEQGTGGEDSPPGPALSWDGSGLTERLFDGPVSLERLIDDGYRYRPQGLSCKADAWEKELPMAISLALKLSAGSGAAPEAIYGTVGQKPGRVRLRRAEDKTIWEARFGEGEFYSDVTIALPSDHESAAVGLGIGQENWWDAEPRPEWLIALERALRVDSAYAWDALSVELHRAGMSEESVQSIQGLMAE